MRRVIFLFLLICIFHPVFSDGQAQAVKDRQPGKQLVRNDSPAPEIRKFNADKIRFYRKSKDFIYDNTVPESESLWSRFWKWFWSFFERVLKDKYTGTLFGYTAIAIVVAFAVYGTMKLMGLDLKILTGKSKIPEVPYILADDNIHEINFSEEIEKAIQNGNYRLAVRMFYLRTLKQLSDKGQIIWQPEKTNQTYIAEIQDIQEKGMFKALTLQFEYVWYGEFHIDKDNFSQIKSGFDQFNHKLR